ncbi:hypothetical protein ABZZ79_28555 [Streptomyces sp. NPDC006458]|uniref:hypothetical protein n=1 Tax=Streptomyces sp. NPDC006458 TaxID=3154302 RepID=UPI0033BC2E8A
MSGPTRHDAEGTAGLPAPGQEGGAGARRFRPLGLTAAARSCDRVRSDRLRQPPHPEAAPGDGADPLPLPAPAEAQGSPTEIELPTVVLTAPPGGRRSGPSGTARHARRWYAVAACLLLVAVASLTGLLLTTGPDDDSSALPRPDQRTGAPGPASRAPATASARRTEASGTPGTASAGPTGGAESTAGRASPGPTGDHGDGRSGGRGHGGSGGTDGTAGGASGGGDATVPGVPSVPDGTGGSAEDAAVVFTDPAPQGDAYVEVDHCAHLTGTARVPDGKRLWFAVRYTHDARYSLMGPADGGELPSNRRTPWSKVIRLGNADQYLKGRVIALFLPKGWADYLLAANGYEGDPALIDSGNGHPYGISAPVLPPDSVQVGELKVQRDRNSRACA